MKYLLFRLKRFCGFSVGFVFFISGLLKLMDPVGAGLVMKEYFKFLHIGFLDSASTFTGTAFAFAETSVGAALVTGVWRKTTAAIAIGLQGFFTFLTTLLVIFKPEMDCGCFGEAIHMTHGETFVKNLVLLALLLIYYIPPRHLGTTKNKKYVAFGAVTLSTAAFTVYSLLYIPMADFTDFKPGTQINRNHEAAGSFEATFVYSKGGKEETFRLENLPDTSWTFVRTETTSSTEKEKTAVVSIFDKDGNYADSLLATGKVMVISLYDSSVSGKSEKRINRFISDSRVAGFSPVVLSVTETEGIDAPVYHCDYKTLITLNRSNGGTTYLNDGFIIRKWAKKALPDLSELTMLSEENPTDTFIGRDARTSLAFQGFLLYVFAVMLLL